MARYLGHHEAIFVPQKKEPFYLARDFDHRNKITTEAAYAGLYTPAVDHRYACDGSTFYLFSETAAQAIYDRCPEAKIIIMLRAPVRQMISMFQHNVVRGNEDQTDMARALDLQAPRAQGQQLPSTTKAPQVLQYERIADYAPQVARYLELFDPAQVHIEIFEEFVTDTPASVARVLAFLDLDPSALPVEALSKAQNVTSEAARPKSHEMARSIGSKSGMIGAVKRLLPTRVKSGIRNLITKTNTTRTHGAADRSS